jgi:drug/metabolite transporter (DMT)-like permease
LDNAVPVPVQTVDVRRAHRSHALMHVLMLVATFCWAGNIIAAKHALTGFSPMALASLRIGGAALLFAALFLARGKPLGFRLTRRHWLVMTLLALSGVTFNQIFFIGGIARTSVAHAGLIVAIGPVMVLVLSCVMRLEALTVSKFVGMLVSFGGVAVLTTGKAAQGNSGHWAGDLILLAASAVFAYYTILVKEVADQYDALTLNTLAFGLGALLMIPFGTWSVLSVPWAAIPPRAWWGLGFMVVFGSVLPYLLFAFAMTELTASRVAAFSYVQPVIATGLGIWLLAEKLTVKIVLGGILILSGVYLTERERGEEVGNG